MKKLFVLVAFVVTAVTQLCFSQIIRINVTEVIESSESDSIDVLLSEFLNNRKLLQTKRSGNSSYILDLTNKTYKFYVRNTLVDSGNIIFTNVGDLYKVKFLIDGYDIGMILDLDVSNEQVTWYCLWNPFDEIREYSKFSKFEIIKAL